MILKVLSIVSFISICAGNQEAKHAISSQSFHREDVPLSYKYSAVHVYTTVKPAPQKAPYPMNYFKSEDSTNFRQIQYAPLLTPEENKQSRLNTKISILKDNELYEPISDVIEASKKDYLEPRLRTTKNTEIYPHLLSHVQYIPGHNIEVLQNGNSNPGHNAVYRSNFQGSGPNENRNKGYQVRHHVIYDIDKQITNQFNNKDTQNAQNVTEVGSKQTQMVQVVPNRYEYRNSENVYKYGDIIPKVGIPQALYLQKPQTKMHAIFLNVARTFSQASVPNRSKLGPSANKAFLENTPTHSQAFGRAPRLVLDSGSSPTKEDKTRLVPLHRNSLHYAIYS